MKTNHSSRLVVFVLTLLLMLFSVARQFSLAQQSTTTSIRTSGVSLDSLVARGMDPRVSNIFSKHPVPQVSSPARYHEVARPTSPRHIRLKNRQATIYPNIQVHPSSVTTQSEMSITTHPSNPDIVLAASNAVSESVTVGSQGWYYTTNGGVNWSGGDTLPTHINFNQFMSDPAAGIDLDGHLFVNAMLYGIGGGSIVVATSTDEGVSWSQSSVPGTTGDIDKNHFTLDADPSSPFLDNLYTAFTDFGALTSPIPVLFSRSTNHGATFSTAHNISDSIGVQFAQGANLAVAKNGWLYTTWTGYDSFPSASRIGFNKSTDGGATWQGATGIRSIHDIRGSLSKGGNLIRVNSFPSMAVDKSDGERQGWIYIVYAERVSATPDIFIIHSTDEGATWSAPIKVNQDGTSKDQWSPWVSVDPITGGLYVVYYDSRNFPLNDSAQVYISASMDGGDTFEDILVSDIPFLPKSILGLASGYMGDYIGISASYGIVWPCWNDDRTGIHQAYTSRIVLVEVGSQPNISVSHDTLDFGDVFLGFPDTLSVTVRNLGYPDTLFVTDISTDSSLFTSDVTSFALAGGTSKKVHVEMNPQSIGYHSAVMTISSNDSLQPTVEVFLKANVIYPPAAGVSPDSLAFTLNEGDSTDATITISNSGLGQLTFEILDSLLPPGMTIPQLSQLQTIAKTYRDRSWQEEFHNAKKKNLSSLFSISSDDLPVVATDPVGDATGTVDVVSINAEVRYDTLWLQLHTAMPIVPSNFAGYISLDVDQDVLTGRYPPAYGYGKATQDVGSEFEISYFSLSSNFVNVEDALSGNIVASFSAVVDSYKVTAGIPLSVLNHDDGNINVSGVLGDSFGPTDWIPDTGHGIIQPVAPWLSVNPTEGIIQPDSSETIQLHIHTDMLDGGTFRAHVHFNTNDPAQRNISVPIQLRVIGVPNIVLSTDTLDFGDGYIGFADTLILQISNNGSDTLHVGDITLNSTDFTIAGSTAFSVPQRQHRDVPVLYTAPGHSSSTGTLTITSDDAGDPTVIVQLIGNGIYPPVIGVTPDSFAVTLGAGDSTTRTMTIGNTGLGDLHWNIESFPGFRLAPKAQIQKSNIVHRTNLADDETFKGSTKDFKKNTNHLAATTSSLPFYDGFESGTYSQWTEDGGTGIREVTASTSAEGTYSFHYNNTTTGHFHGIHVNFPSGSQPEYIGFYLRSGSTSLSDGYFVLSGDSTIDQNAIFFFARGNGAFYVNEDVGGDNTYSYNALQWYFIEFQNIDWLNKTFDYYINHSLVKSNILFRNANSVNEFRGLYLYNWDASDAWWDAISIGKREWVSATPSSGAVSSNSTQEVTIKFSAANLEGDNYRANIVINNNDPSNNKKMIQAQLHVVGKPVIVLNPDSVDFGSGFIGYEKPETVIVKNTGTDSLLISNISSNNPVFTITPTQLSISKHSQHAIVITFAPPDTIDYTGALTIESNDSNHLMLNVPLHGHGIYPPNITVTPDSFSVSIGEGDSTTRTMTIGNTGLGNLSWEIQTTTAAASSSKISTLPSVLIKEFQRNPDGGKYKSISRKLIEQNRLCPSIKSVFGDLTGKRIGISDTSSYSVIVHDLEARGALITIIYFPLSVEILSNLDVITFDDYIGSASPTDISLIRSWLQTGKGLLLQGDDASSMNNINALFAGTGISETSYGTYYDAVLTDILPHTITTGVDSINAGAYGSYSNVSIPAQTVVFDGFSNPHAAVSTLGAGRVVAVCNEATMDYNISLFDTRLFSNQVFDWLAIGGDFLSTTPISGEVLPSATEDVTVKFKATSLEGGDYQANIVITNNDPAHNPKNIPAHLHVIGKPVIVVNPDSISFGNAFIGFGATETLIVKNKGSDSLIVSNITSNNAVFTVDQTAFTVPKHSERQVLVTFVPLGTVDYSGLLTISSNDSTHLTLNVPLSGHGIYPPNITVTPDSFSVSVGERDSTTRTMTIGNTGLGNLSWEIQTSSATASSIKAKTLPSVLIKEFQRNPDGGKYKSISRKLIEQNRLCASIKSVFGDLTGKRIGISDTSSYSVIVHDLEARGALITIIYFPLSVEILSNLDVITFDDYIGSASPTDISLIRSWLQTGKGLLLQGDDASSMNNINALFAGTGISETSYDTYYYAVLTDILPHTITTGVDTINALAYGSYCNVSLPAQTIVLDGFSNPHVVVSTMGAGKVVAICNEASSNFNLSVGDTRLFANQVFDWLGGPGDFLSITPISGMVLPSATEEVTVKFNAKTLGGGDYRANIVITNNDPAHNPKIVPAHLHVKGKPVIAINPDSINFGNSYVGFGISETLVVKNNGSDSLKVSNLSSNNAVFTVNQTSFTVPKHSERAVLVTFTPTDTLHYTASLTIASNDSSHLTLNVPLRGHGIYPPNITVTPDSFVVTLKGGSGGDSTTRTLKIGNTGLGSLNWKINLTGTSIPTSAPALLQRNILGGTETKMTADRAFMLNHKTGSNSGNPTISQYSWHQFLNIAGTKKILAWVGYTDRSPGGEFENTLNAIYQYFTDFTLDTISTTSPSTLNTLLQDKDIFIVPEQEQINDLTSLGNSFSSALASFVQNGGTMIVLDHWNSGATTMLNGTGLLNISNVNPSADYIAEVIDSTSHLVRNLPSTFLAMNGSNYHNSSDGRNIIREQNSHNNIVTSKNIGSGEVIYIGMDYFSYDSAMARLIANAVEFSKSSNFLSATLTSGTVVPGDTQNVVIKIKAKDLTIGSYRANVVISSNDPAHQQVSVPIRLDILTGVDEHVENLPVEFKLHQNFPNPFNPATTIKYGLPVQSYVKLTLYNILGQEVVILAEGMQSAGWQSITWNAETMPSGLYFYRIVARSTTKNGNTFIQTQKMLLLK